MNVLTQRVEGVSAGMLWITPRYLRGFVENLWKAVGVLWIKNRIEPPLFPCTERGCELGFLSKVAEHKPRVFETQKPWGARLERGWLAHR